MWHSLRGLPYFVWCLVLAIVVGWLMTIGQSVHALTSDDVTITRSQHGLTIALNTEAIEITFLYKKVAVGQCQDGMDPDTFTELIVQNRIAVLNDANLGEAYCFLITTVNEHQEADTLRYSYQVLGEPVDQQPPIIEVQRPSNTLVIAQSENEDADYDSWSWQIFDQAVDCREEVLDRRSSNTVLRIALRENNNGAHLCISLADNNGNRGFVRYAITDVDITAPVITIRQNQRLLVASASEAVSDWSHTFSPSNLHCNQQTFLNNRTIVKSHQATLTQDKMDYYYCFRARDAAGNFGYNKHRVTSVNFTAAVIRLQQNGRQLIVQSSDNIQSWSYIKTKDSRACGQNTDFSQATPGSSSHRVDLTDNDHNLFFCVKVLNAANSTSYAKIRATLQTSGQVIITIADNQIEATSTTKNLRWEYIKTGKEVACNSSSDNLFSPGDNFDYSVGNRSALYASDNNQWFCFRGTNANQTHILYGKKQVSGIKRLRPGEQTKSQAGRDIVILTGFIILATGVFLIYIIRRFKQQGLPVSTPNTPRDTKKGKKKQGKSAPQKDIVQPLDFLKDDKED